MQHNRFRIPKRWLPWLGVALCLAMTLSAWFFAKRAEDRRIYDRFQAETVMIRDRTANRMAAHEQLLRAVAEFVSLHPALPTRQEWHHYVYALELDRLNPGVQALGFAEWIPTPALEAHVRRLRAEGFPDYEVRPGGPLAPDEGYSSVIYVEPFDARNQRAFARDMYAEPIRRAALARARDTGLVALTGLVKLYQETSTQVQAGTLLFVPVYRHGAPLETVVERRQALVGWVYLAFRMQNLMEGILGSSASGMSLELFDGESEQEGRRLYATAPLSGPSEGWSTRYPLEVGGRVWTILDLSKVEAGKPELEDTSFDLQEMLDELTVAMTVRAREKGLSFRCSIDPDTPRRLRGDPGRLKQVLTNLVSNALKFTAEGEVVVHVTSLSADEKEAMLRFAVRDTGIGIAADKRDYIFQSFTQADASTTRRFGGTGLGLSISKRLVSLLGGKIGVSSELGKGSEFWFTARLRRQPEGAATTCPMTEAPPSLASKRYRKASILLAEDNRVNQELVEALLEQCRLTTDVAMTGAEAIEALRRKRYDLVFMDVQMPTMDGLEATSIIRAPDSGVIDPNVPIVAMTAHAMPEDRKRCMDAGMNDYLSKPIDAAALARVLDRYLSESSEETPAPAAEATGPADPPPAFDDVGLLRRVMGDKKIAIRIAQAFLTDVPNRVSSMQAALDAGDATQVARGLHAMKGASASLGGEALHAQALALEVLAGEKNLEALRSRFPELL